jgi:hypothetical protein
VLYPYSICVGEQLDLHVNAAKHRDHQVNGDEIFTTCFIVMSKCFQNAYCRNSCNFSPWTPLLVKITVKQFEIKIYMIPVVMWHGKSTTQNKHKQKHHKRRNARSPSQTCVSPCSREAKQTAKRGRVQQKTPNKDLPWVISVS